MTHFYGTNSSGKTLVCKLIYECITKKGIDDNQGDFSIDIEFQNSYDEKRIITCVRENAKIYYYENSERLPFFPLNVEIIYLREKFIKKSDHVEAIADCFCIDKEVVLSVLKKDYFKGSKINEVKIAVTRSKPYLVRKVLISNIEGLLIDLDYCSGAEIGIFLVEVGFLISKFLSRKSTVLYVLDWGNISCFDDNYMNSLIDRLQNYEEVFQSIIVSPDAIPQFEWNGWQIARFKNMIPNTIIDQNHFE